jgi:hypothetical protein
MMLVFLTTLEFGLRILRSRAAVELENLALAKLNRRVSKVRRKAPEINLRRPSVLDLSLPLWCDCQGLNFGEGQVQRVSLSDIITAVDSPVLAEAHSPAHICFCGPA